MKKLIFATAITAILASCSGQYTTVTIENGTDFDRTGEMVEIDLDSLPQDFTTRKHIYVTSADGNEIPSQLTHNRKLIFAADVKSGEKAAYHINYTDTPHYYNTIAKGRPYPERDDDMAWENDKVGFRAYGPALQNRGERGFGYDIFLKRDTIYPILDMLYAIELNPESWAKTDSIRRTEGDAAAEEFIKTFSYHIDHGYGMDCYAVGPTLGAGVSALLENDTIVYPWCYREAEILDNGPLRFSVKLTFTPLRVNADSAVIETRVITLDAGSQLNRTDITYTGLTSPAPIATGIVLHDTEGAVTTDPERAYISYVDPTQGADNGKVFMGAVFPVSATETRIDRNDNAPSHVLAISPFNPGDVYSYYWGFAWDKTDITDIDSWNEYLSRRAAALRSPLKINIEK